MRHAHSRGTPLRLPFLLAALYLLYSLPSLGNSTNQSTANLAELLARQRGKESLTSEDYKDVQNEYLKWLDARVKNREGLEKMNSKLSSAGLLAQGSETVEDSYRAHTGFLAPIHFESIHESGLLALRVGIYSGNGCNRDETLVIYKTAPLQRILTINSDNVFSGVPRHLSGFELGKADSTQRRMVATGWIASNCTSVWNGGMLKVDIVNNGSHKTILHREVGAYEEGPEDRIRAIITGNIVEFRYRSSPGELDAVALPVVSRYRLVAERLVREAPIALTRSGFLREWLNLDDDEAERWSSAGASALHHSVSSQFVDKNFEWETVSRCPDGSYEFGVQIYESDLHFVFRLRGSTASVMRMLTISRMPSPACKQLDISTDRSSIYAKIPR